MIILKHLTTALVITCILAIIGFFIPTITLQLSFLGINRTINMSLATLFESESPFGEGGFAASDLADLFGEIDFMDEIRGVIIRSAIAYSIVLILIVIVLITTLIGKLKRVNMVILTLSILLFIYAGRSILTVPDILFDGLDALLGFLALFISFRDMLTLSLGNGYWITLATMCIGLFITLIIFLSSLTITYHKSGDLQRR